jgi:hypothetical protein
MLYEGTRKVKSQKIYFPKCRRHSGKFVPSLPADSPATVTISGSPEQLQPEFRKIKVSFASWQSETGFRKLPLLILTRTSNGVACWHLKTEFRKVLLSGSLVQKILLRTDR